MESLFGDVAALQDGIDLAGCFAKKRAARRAASLVRRASVPVAAVRRTLRVLQPGLLSLALRCEPGLHMR